MWEFFLGGVFVFFILGIFSFFVSSVVFELLFCFEVVVSSGMGEYVLEGGDLWDSFSLGMVVGFGCFVFFGLSSVVFSKLWV